MERYCCLRNVQDLLAEGKTPYERRFAESFEGPIIPFGALVEYLPNSERDKARIHQFGEKSITILIADIEKLEKLKTECKGSLDILEKRRICISCGGWFSKIIRKGLLIPRTHSETGSHRKERVSPRRISRR